MTDAHLVALIVQPDDPVEDTRPPSYLEEGDVLLFSLFVALVVAVFGFDMMRTWWETNRWKRDARRRRKEMR